MIRAVLAVAFAAALLAAALPAVDATAVDRTAGALDRDVDRIDADDCPGDGDQERIGRSERVLFEASTTIVAVVLPGPLGVGDVDGNRDERSPGWPCPGDGEGCEEAPE